MRQLLLLAVILVFIESCHENPEPLTPEDLGYWGFCTVLKDGKEWTGSPIATYPNDKGIFIGLDSFDKNLIYRASLNFLKVPKFPGTYRLSNTFYQINDGLVGALYAIRVDDYFLGDYKVLEADSSSFLTLLSYDSTSREIKGKFDITFIVEHRPDPSYPDTIRFRNGMFHTRLRN